VAGGVKVDWNGAKGGKKGGKTRGKKQKWADPNSVCEKKKVGSGVVPAVGVSSKRVHGGRMRELVSLLGGNGRNGVTKH